MDKLENLFNILSRYDSAVIAFSGGVDSTFLARVAREVLQDRLLLVTATSFAFPFHELEESKKLAKQMNIAHKVITSEEMNIPGYSNNPPDRCYYCKSEVFEKIKYVAQQEGYHAVFDGTNAGDTGDYRPGMKALKEKEIESPLKEAGMTKDDIRHYSREYGLPTADKPAESCLASRFPYGEKIDTGKLDRVSRAELRIKFLGFTQFRVRSHNDLARLEFIPKEMDRAWQMRQQLNKICKEAGYTYVTIDTTGYRSGAMNETLKKGASFNSSTD
ncbi:MAG: ATP-dependent sacrificial sulfur transferase LarE [Bacteroidales bacterium]